MRARAARRNVALVTAALLMLRATSALADRQMDPELRGVLAEVITPAGCFDDKYDRALWFASMGPRLARYVKDEKEREQILHHVHCESRRVSIPPDLVLAVMDVGRFDHYAGSRRGRRPHAGHAVLASQLGMSNEQLIRVADVRGPAILSYYLRKGAAAIPAHARYNGSLGADYSDKVIDRLASWRYCSSGDSACGESGGRAGAAETVSTTTLSTRSRRSLPQPRTKLLDRRHRTARQHFDAAVGQIARIARDAEFPGAIARAGTEVDALHAAGNEGAASDPVAQG
jgi:hypothetical protein